MSVCARETWARPVGSVMWNRRVKTILETDANKAGILTMALPVNETEFSPCEIWRNNT